MGQRSLAMDREIRQRRAKWREGAAASLITGVLILLLLGLAIFVAINAAPLVDELPVTATPPPQEAASPDKAKDGSLPPP
jgi:hypothetical protein